MGTRRGWVAALRRSTGRALGVAACAALTAWAIGFEHLRVCIKSQYFGNKAS